jgi:signal transduction histidine kinase
VAADLESRGAELTVDGPLPTALGHFETLVHVLSNLLGNGAKFVAPGVPPKLEVRAERLENRIRLWVEDNGIGIDPEHFDRIFRVFERLHGHEQYPGTGIGLAIVHKGMARQGGSAGVESAPGKGSRFWIELPAVDRF